MDVNKKERGPAIFQEEGPVCNSYLFEFFQEAVLYFGRIGFSCDSAEIFKSIPDTGTGID